jgi:hypothetical protein
MDMTHAMSMRSNFRNYTYIEDMKAEALITLCRGWKNIDADHPLCNPHGYISRCIWQSFVKLIKKEHDLRAVRDEYLIASGFDPSFDRQVTHEMDLATERQYSDALQPDESRSRKPAGKPGPVKRPRGRPAKPKAQE